MLCYVAMIGRDNERRVLGADEAAHHEESEVFAKADRESLGLRGLDFGLLQGNGFVRPQRDSAARSGASKISNSY